MNKIPNAIAIPEGQHLGGGTALHIEVPRRRNPFNEAQIFILVFVSLAFLRAHVLYIKDKVVEDHL